MVAETPQGLVEYAWHGQSGPVVVICHGLPGGFDQSLAIAGWLSAAPCRFLCISRPGYLGTPLTSGETMERQADLIAATLDALGVQDAAVLGMSAGGPAAVRFAIRHPERCWALILACAVATRIRSRMPLKFLGLIVWLVNRFVHWTARRDREAVLEVADTLVPIGPRAAGIVNDVAQFARLPETVPGGVRCPTLVIHGDADRIVPFRHGEAYRKAIPQAQFLLLENGNHWAGVVRRHEVSAHVTDFLVKLKR